MSFLTVFPTTIIQNGTDAISEAAVSLLTLRHPPSALFAGLTLACVWKIGSKYYRWLTSPLNRLPGPKHGFWVGSFLEIFNEPFMQPHLRWWKKAQYELYDSTTDDSFPITDSKSVLRDVPLLSYSGIMGGFSLLVLDADIVQEILGDQSVSKEKIRYVKRYEQLKTRMGEGLVTLEGPDWSRHRRIIQPSFQTSVLECTLDETVYALTQKLIASWKNAGTNRVIDLDTHLQALTLDIIGQAGFSYDFDALKAVEHWQKTAPLDNEIAADYGSLSTKEMVSLLKPIGAVKVDHPFVVALDKLFGRQSLLETLLFIVRVGWLVPYVLPNSATNRKNFDDAAQAVVHEASEKLKQGDAKSKSLLQLLLNASDTSPVESPNTPASTTKRNTLSLTELRDEVKTFLIAGHETTSTWCYWALYHVAKEPTLQEKLYDDIRQHLNRSDDCVSSSSAAHKKIGLAEVERMEYLAAFLDEVLRFYPPVGMLFRYNTQEEIFKGQKIPVNTRIIIPIFLVHRNPKYWGSDAEVFRPERWLERTIDNGKRHPYSFIPFSAGGRNCIGYRFAKIEAKIIMANIIHSFSVKLAKCMPPDVKLTSRLTVKSKPLVKICVEERS